MPGLHVIVSWVIGENVEKIEKTYVRNAAVKRGKKEDDSHRRELCTQKNMSLCSGPTRSQTSLSFC